jgi:hypothetical protein
MSELENMIVTRVAREIARPKASGATPQERFESWNAAAIDAVPDAHEKINAMTNMELIAAIEEALTVMGKL